MNVYNRCVTVGSILASGRFGMDPAPISDSVAAEEEIITPIFLSFSEISESSLKKVLELEKNRFNAIFFTTIILIPPPVLRPSECGS